MNISDKINWVFQIRLMANNCMFFLLLIFPSLILSFMNINRKLALMNKLPVEMTVQIEINSQAIKINDPIKNRVNNKLGKILNKLGSKVICAHVK